MLEVLRLLFSILKTITDWEVLATHLENDLSFSWFCWEMAIFRINVADKNWTSYIVAKRFPMKMWETQCAETWYAGNMATLFILHKETIRQAETFNNGSEEIKKAKGT